MNLNSVFIFVTNIFGLNFFEEVAPFTLVILMNISFDVFTIVMIYLCEAPIQHFKSVFACVDFIQLVLPLVVKDFVFIRAMFNVEFDKKLEHKITTTFAPEITMKQQKIYLVTLTFYILVYSVKVLDSNVYNWSQYFPNIFNAATDLFFVYQIMRLRDHFRDIQTRKCSDLKAEIIKAIEIQRALFSRYSKYLAIAISLYFILIIISLYWIFLRIIFNNFDEFWGESLSIEKNQKGLEGRTESLHF